MTLSILRGAGCEAGPCPWIFTQVTSPDSHTRARILLLDIEGTTTPIDFVYKTLFPYARANMKEFLMTRLSGGQLSEEVAGLAREHRVDVRAGLSPPALSEDSLVEYLYWLMDQDRKSTALKSIQGKIWEAGYNRGELKSEVFADVPVAFERWTSQGREICIYSSGSVLAQKLLFANTEAGDLTPFIRAYFDTNIGPKKDAASYCKIAGDLMREPGEIMFVSDVADELEAARSAGLQTLLCIRPGNAPQASADRYEVISSFHEVLSD